MTTVTCRVGYNDQNGYYASNTSGYENAAANVNMVMVPNGIHVWRFPVMVPAGATINSATLRLVYNSKFGDSNGTSSHSIRYHSGTTNSAPLVQGELFSARTVTSLTTVTANISANTGNQVVSVSVTNVIQAANTIPGGYITFYAFCNTESGDLNWKMDADGSPPELVIDYTESSTSGERWEFNQLKNPTFNTNLDHWGQSDFFGANVTNGTMVRDTSFTRSGRPTLKFTTPAPSGTKAAGVSSAAFLPYPNTSYIFSGWIYIQSAITAAVTAGFAFQGNTVFIDDRNAWIPFCTNPHPITTTAALFPAINIFSGFASGQSFWISDLTVQESKFRQMPWNGSTPDKTTVITEAPYNTSRGPHARKILNKTRVIGTGSRAMPNYVMNSNGLWVLAPPVLG